MAMQLDDIQLQHRSELRNGVDGLIRKHAHALQCVRLRIDRCRGFRCLRATATRGEDYADEIRARVRRNGGILRPAHAADLYFHERGIFG